MSNLSFWEQWAIGVGFYLLIMNTFGLTGLSRQIKELEKQVKQLEKNINGKSRFTNL
jgi:hypothetical protein